MRAWRVARPDFFDAPAIPRLRRITSASPMSPLPSTRAFLHSIIPAPVRWRSSFTNAAVIAAIFLLFRLFEGPQEAAPEFLVAAFLDGLFGFLGGGLGRGSLTRSRSGLFFHAQALGHDLLGVLGIDVFLVFHHDVFHRRLIGDDLIGGE